MPDDRQSQDIRFGEFVALSASLFALVALSIDAILPALREIGRDLDVAQANDTQLIISFLFFGFASGQILYGPLSDTIGRKVTIYIGVGLYLIGTLVAMLAGDLTWMLAGRVLQGLGVAAPRTVMVAVVRDKYEGAAMARVMSYVMAVFILVPTIAPSLGQAILFFADWQAIFVMFFAFALMSVSWFALRLPETLKPENRIPFSFRRTSSAIASVFRNRTAFGYTITTGIIFGAFLGYLSSAQQVFQEYYGLGEWFALYFALLSLAIGAAAITNAKLVMRFGMRPLTWRSLLSMSGLSIVFLGYALIAEPPLWATTVYFLAAFFFVGILFGNLNALAMEPLGKIAGTGSAVIGAMTSLMSLPMGIAIGRSYDESVVPLVAGFAVLGSLACVSMYLTDRKSL